MSEPPKRDFNMNQSHTLLGTPRFFVCGVHISIISIITSTSTHTETKTERGICMCIYIYIWNNDYTYICDLVWRRWGEREREIERERERDMHIYIYVCDKLYDICILRLHITKLISGIGWHYFCILHGEASNTPNATQASAVWQPSAWASLSRLVLVELRWIGCTPWKKPRV